MFPGLDSTSEALHMSGNRGRVDLYLYFCHIADWGDRRRKDFDLEILFINGIYCSDFERFLFSSLLNI